MAIDYEQLLAWKIPSVEQDYTEKDVMLYALGLGLGLNEDDPNQLRFVYEDGLRILPTQATVLGYPGFWLSDPATGINWKQVLHGEQGLEIHRPLPVTGKVIGRTHVDAIIDKGPDKGALLYSTRQLFEKTSDELLCTLAMTNVLRAEGGFGGPDGPVKQPPVLPTGEPEIVHELRTSLQTGLIYRLSGDWNPLHADPAIARAAGFDRPILHGLASFGMAGYGIVSQLCEGDPTRLRALSMRFSSPVYPGETLRIEMWRVNVNRYLFRAKALERNVIVLNNGQADFADNA